MDANIEVQDEGPWKILPFPRLRFCHNPRVNTDEPRKIFSKDTGEIQHVRLQTENDVVKKNWT